MFDRLSFATAKLSVFDKNSKLLSEATGFFYQNNSGLFLITNWHVVTGRSSQNPLFSKTAAVPCSISFDLLKKINETHIQIENTVSTLITINQSDGESPEWLEHPNLGTSVDVVALKLNEENLKDLIFSPVNQIKEFEQGYDPRSMDTVFVVGYPWGLCGGGPTFPIYKRGSIASEPIINFDNLPVLLIDCRTTPSMSGSPVIVSHSGLWMPNGVFDNSSMVGTVSNFIGVYSGRLKDNSDKEVASEIGRVFKKEVIDVITSKGKSGTKISEL